MSQRDRSGQERGFETDPRRDPRTGDRPTGQPTNRPRQSTLDDEGSQDLPAWSGQGGRPASRDQGERAGSGSGRAASSSSPRDVRPAGRREPLPQLGDAFRRSSRSSAYDDVDTSPASTKDPYDRLRRVAAKPQRPVSFDDDAETEAAYDAYPDDDLEPAPREPRARTRSRSTGTRYGERPPAAYRPPATQQIGGMIAAAAPQTRFIAAILGIDLISVVFMAATVAGRASSLPDWIPIHLNAEGAPDMWGPPHTLWQIPVMAVMLTIMAGAFAWFVAKRDPFAARFSLGSTILIHVLCWIAVLNLAW